MNIGIGEPLKSNWINLYADIFKKAVLDDIRVEPKRLQKEVFNEIINMGTFIPEKAIKKEYLVHKADHEQAIKMRVYNESLTWPKRADDVEYRRQYIKIKNKIIDAVLLKNKGVS